MDRYTRVVLFVVVSTQVISACSVNGDCGQSLVCRPRSLKQNLNRICARKGEFGEACDYYDDCVGNMKCYGNRCGGKIQDEVCSSNDECAWYLVCRPWTSLEPNKRRCTARGGYGKPCDYWPDCVGNSKCYGNKCGGKSVNEKCNSNVECSGELVCRPYFSSNVSENRCAPRGRAGDTCDYWDDCLWNANCANGKCDLQSSATSMFKACSVDKECGPLLTCRPLSPISTSVKRCGFRTSAGGVCDSDADCVGNLKCSRNVCGGNTFFNIQSCKTDVECGNGFVCRPLWPSSKSVKKCLAVGSFQDTCDTDNDCIEGLGCHQYKCGGNQESGKCTTNSDCAGDLVCSSDKKCSPEVSSCTSNSDCLGESVCRPQYLSSTASSKCAKKGEHGETCDYWDDCVGNIKCHGNRCGGKIQDEVCSSDNECACNLVCRPWTYLEPSQRRCTARGGFGEPCDYWSDCVGNMKCHGNKCGGKSVNETCSSNNECSGDLVCRPYFSWNFSVRRCAPKGRAGDTCDYWDDCSWNANCANGKCDLQSSATSMFKACSVDKECGPLLTCRPLSPISTSVKRCGFRTSAGGVCDSDADCVGNLKCSRNVCGGNTFFNIQSCKTDVECGNGFVCRPLWPSSKSVKKCLAVGSFQDTCDTDNDCIEGLGCHQYKCGGNQESGKCTTNSDCAGDLVCSSDKKCSPEVSSCTSNSDCLGESVCRPQYLSSTASSKCAKKGEHGETCDYWDDCVGNIKCHGNRCGGKIQDEVCSSDNECACNLVCRPWTYLEPSQRRCTARGGFGEPCDYWSDCVGNIKCHGNKCGGKSVNEKCSSNNECSGDLVCRPYFSWNISERRCAPKGVVGNTCDYWDDCKENMKCTNNKCTL